jgi:hypothetical protein
MFGTVRDLTQEHLAATVTPPIGVTAAAKMMTLTQDRAQQPLIGTSTVEVFSLVREVQHGA